MQILLLLIVIGIVVFFHELGHYLFAKRSKCGVEEFAIGFGPKLLSFTYKETRYRINLLPIGGYVKLLGEMEEDIVPKIESKERDNYLLKIKKYNLKKFSDLSVRKRISILSGGVLAQLLFTILIFYGITIFVGFHNSRVVINKVLSDSPAELANMQSGDVIVSIDKKAIRTDCKIISIVGESANRELDFLVKRNEEQILLEIIPKYNPEEGKTLIGVGLHTEMYYSKEGKNFFDFLTSGVVLTARLTRQVLAGFYKLITLQISPRYLTGPIGIVAIGSRIAGTGMLNLIIFIAIININLVIINAFPFPALDGGHILILSVEKLFRRKIKPNVKNIINTLGFALLIMLILYVSYHDIIRLRGNFFSNEISIQREKTP